VLPKQQALRNPEAGKHATLQLNSRETVWIFIGPNPGRCFYFDCIVGVGCGIMVEVKLIIKVS
jgi:hypothetical protein